MKNKKIFKILFLVIAVFVFSTELLEAKESLINCRTEGNDDTGLCYDRGTSCPSGTREIVDSFNICGTSYRCCTWGSSYIDCSDKEGSAFCVDEAVLCLRTNNADTKCGADRKCCYIDRDSPTILNTPTPTSTSTSAPSSTSTPVSAPSSTTTTPTLYDSQCSSTSSDGKTQTGCTHANDAAILDNQCKRMFAPHNCTSMSTYLNVLSAKCSSISPPPVGIDCAMISKDGIYGREASKFSKSLIAGASTSTGASGGKLDFSAVTEAGLPDPVGGLKAVLTGFLNWLLGIIGIIALIAFVISGGQYFLVAGDEKMVETAKRNMRYSILGVITALSGFVIIKAIDFALKAEKLF